MAREPMLASRTSKAFISTITIQAIAVLVLIGFVYNQVEQHVDFDQNRYKTLPCYLALFALAEIFELVMSFDALRMRNVIQLIGILIFHLGLIIFSGIQIHQTHTALVTAGDCDGSASDLAYRTCGGSNTLWRKIQPFLIAVPSVTGVSWLVMMVWIRNLYQEFGWAIFRVVGADRSMKYMYQWYQIMLCLLKFDFFCFTGVTMQLLIIVLQDSTAEYGITIVAIPVVLILLFACGLAVQREIKWLMTFSLILMPAALSYLYKLIRFYEPGSRDEYETTRATLTVFTVVAFILLFATFAVGLRCFSDFNRGLRPSKVHGQSSVPPAKPSLATKDSHMSERHSSHTMGTSLAHRISIE